MYLFFACKIFLKICCHPATNPPESPCLWGKLGGGKWVAGWQQNGENGLFLTEKHIKTCAILRFFEGKNAEMIQKRPKNVT